MTIDIAWRCMNRRPAFRHHRLSGHEQYTRNMANRASHADVAILLVDVRHEAAETRRHAAICDLVGIKKVILAVNKMDLVEFAEARYHEIEFGGDLGEAESFRPWRGTRSRSRGSGARRSRPGPSC